jgi:hypothetical protein
MLSNNPFEQEFILFKESTLFEGLVRKYQPTPYYKKYGLIRMISLISSYGFNLLSGVTASSLIFLFLNALSRSWILAMALTISSILFLELLKRKLGSIIFKEYFTGRKIQWLTIIAFTTCSCISVVFSYYGSKKMVIELSNTPITISNDSTISVLDLELQDIDEQITNARNTRWKGTTTTESQQTINLLSKQKELVLSELFRVTQKTDTQNDYLEKEHNQTVLLQANQFALATMIFEVLFLICSCYLEYYDYRSYVEFLRPLSNPTPLVNNLEKKDNNPVATNIIDPSILIGAIKNAKANLAAYRTKLQQGKGTDKTNRAGIKRWEAKIKELEDLFPKNGHQEPIK